MGWGRVSPAPWPLLLGPVGCQSFMKACVLLALVIPHAVVMSHALPPFCRPGAAITGAALFVVRVSPPDTTHHMLVN